MTTEDTRAAPRIYVASLADYNAGRIHGRWIDASTGLDKVRAQIASMLQTSATPGAEEWAIHDHEGFEPLRIRESPSLTWLTDVATGIRRHGEAFAAWEACINQGSTPANQFVRCYLGSLPPSSIEGDASELANGVTFIPATHGGFHVFRSDTPDRCESDC